MKKSILRLHKPLLKETFKRLLVPAICVCAITLINSITYAYSAFKSDIIGQDFHIDMSFLPVAIVILMAITAYQLGTKLRDKSTNELFGSIPVSRDSLWTTYLSAGLILSLGTVIAWGLGYLIGSSIGQLNSFISIGNYGYNVSEVIVDIIAAMLEGIGVFGLICLVLPITGRTFSAIVATGILGAFFPILNICLGTYCDLSLPLINILIPTGVSTVNVLSWVLKVILPLALLYFSRMAIINSRNEISGNGYRSFALNVIFGVALASELLMGFGLIIDNAGSNDSQMLGAILIFLLITVVTYFAFMWISSRKIKTALRSFAYLPIAFAMLMLTVLSSKLIQNVERNMNLSLNNIESVSFNFYCLPNYDDVIWGDYDMNYLFGNTSPYEFVDRYGKGCGAEKTFKVTDKAKIEKLFDFSQTLRLEVYSRDIFSYATGGLSGSGEKSVTINFKDGRKLTLSIDDLSCKERDIYEVLSEDKDYQKLATDVDKFKDGHFVLADERFDSLYDTFIEELSLLSDEQRFDLMNLDTYVSKGDYYEGFESSTTIEAITGNKRSFDDDFDDSSYHTYTVTNPKTLAFDLLFIATNDNSCIRAVKLSTLTPKTLKAYIALADNECEMNKAFKEYVNEFDVLCDVCDTEYWASNSADFIFFVYDSESDLVTCFDGFWESPFNYAKYSFEEYYERYYGYSEEDLEVIKLEDPDYYDSLVKDYEELLATGNPDADTLKTRKEAVKWLQDICSTDSKAADSRYILFVYTMDSNLIDKRVDENGEAYNLISEYHCSSPIVGLTYQPLCFAMTDEQYAQLWSSYTDWGLGSTFIPNYGGTRYSEEERWFVSAYNEYVIFD